MEALSAKFKEKLKSYSEVDIQNLAARLRTLEGIGPSVSEYMELVEIQDSMYSGMICFQSEDLYSSNKDEYFKAA